MSEKKSKLHEVLAVEAGLKTTADNVLKEANATFDKRHGHFDGHSKTYVARSDEDKEVMNADVKEIVTTVPDKLAYIEESLIRLLDCQGQKELTNTKAFADVVLEDGTVIMEHVPATMLLQLEKKVKAIREVYANAITLDPSKVWRPDATMDDVFMTDAVKSSRSRKEPIPLELSPATKEHPAQVQLITKDVQVGDWTVVYKSGAISLKRKSELLTRIDELERAVKRARQRANTQEVEKLDVGKKLFKFINEGT